MSTAPDPDEQRYLDAIRALDTPAPAALRARVEAMAAQAGGTTGTAAEAGASGASGEGAARAGATGAGAGQAATTRRRLPRPRIAFAGGLLAAVVAVAVVLVLVLGGGDNAAGPPASVRQVAAVALREPTAPAPAARPGGTLDAEVPPVAFPDWQQHPPGPAGAAWSASGARSDTVGGRAVETVFYAAPGGEQVGYAIAGGDELPVAGGRFVRRGGIDMWVYDVDGAPAVMWYRDGRTCVVTGRDVDVDTLLTLAASEPA